MNDTKLGEFEHNPTNKLEQTEKPSITLPEIVCCLVIFTAFGEEIN